MSPPCAAATTHARAEQTNNCNILSGTSYGTLHQHGSRRSAGVYNNECCSTMFPKHVDTPWHGFPSSSVPRAVVAWEQRLLGVHHFSHPEGIREEQSAEAQHKQ
jgi:hypothetical protein